MPNQTQSHTSPSPAGSHWSPLRYPGGKRALLPYARTWLTSLPRRPKHLVEAFAGGAGVGLTALSEDLIDGLTLIELDADVANLWSVVFSERGTDLADYVQTISSPAAAHGVLQLPRVDPLDHAVHTLIHNRLSYNGIRAAGAGMLGAPDGAPASSWCFNPETLAARIRALSSRRACVTVINDDALAVLPTFASSTDTVFYLDPPYSAAGTFASRLYPHWQLDHHRLMTVTSELEGPFLFSHQDAALIRRLAGKHHFGLAEVTPVRKTRELLMSRDLRWLARTGRPYKLISPGPLASPHVDLNLLASFVAVAEELHYGRAARRLGIAAPALSQRVSRLEAQLGTKLFARTTRRVALTQRGQVLYSRVVAPLTSLDLALAGS